MLLKAFKSLKKNIYKLIFPKMRSDTQKPKNKTVKKVIRMHN